MGFARSTIALLTWICVVFLLLAQNVLSKPKYSADVLNVHIVAHTHDDVGWLKTVDEYFYGANMSIQYAGVQYILDTVITALQQNPERKFIYVEIAFFIRWWNEQPEEKKQIVRDLVREGRLEFINGGWCMNDEATTHYTDVIDQMTHGHTFLFREFGIQPTIGWHIDPFGHSASHAALFAKMGFNGFFFARIDYQDYKLRNDTSRFEMIWRGIKSYHNTADMFTGVIYDGYGPPGGFCFECGDPPIQDDPRLFDMNIKQRADEFVDSMKKRGLSYRTNHVLATFGSDFQFMNAQVNFKNMDKLIKYINSNNYGVHVFYSTPSLYVEAVHSADLTWEVKTDDFFPYADGPHSYWTGYFTSRAPLKGYVRTRMNLYHTTDQLLTCSALTDGQIDFNLQLKRMEVFGDAQGIAQHHDAVSGTEKQHVAYDYAKRLATASEAAFDTISDVTQVLVSKTSTKPTFSHCPYLNESICPALDNLSNGKTIAIVVNNPLAWDRTQWVHFPSPVSSVKVLDSNGNGVSADVLPSYDVKGGYNVYFQVTVPALGFTTYFIQPSSKKAFVPKVETPKDDVVVDGKYIRVTYSGTSNLLVSIENKAANRKLSVQQNFFYYNASTGNKEDGQASGAYIFRPNSSNTFPINERNIPTIQVVRGNYVTEIHQTWGNWVYHVSKIYMDSTSIETEGTYGPIPISDGLGKELITRFDTNLNTGNYYYTDSNGLEYLQRKTNYRPTWNLTVTEPVAGNYYPMNVGAYIKDDSAQIQLTLLTDRSRGAASLKSGSLETMINRRLLKDDSRGVGEPLNETVPIRTFGSIIVDTPANSARQYRQQTQYINYPFVYMFSVANSPSEYLSNFKTTFAPMNKAFPTNLRLESLKTREDRYVILRLAHLYAEGEDSQYSQPVTVDMRDFFVGLEPIKSSEYTLTANRPLNELHRLRWKTSSQKDQMLNNEVSVPDADIFKVTISPMDIRTFIVRFQNTGRSAVF